MESLHDSKKKILLIGGEAASLINFRLELVKKMIAKNYQVHVIASYDSKAEAILKKIGVQFHPLEIDRHSLSFLKNITYFLQLYKKIKAIKADICLSYTVKPVIYGSIAAALNKVKNRFCLITGLGYVFTNTSIKAKCSKVIILILYALAFRLSKKIIFQNKDDRNYMLKLKLIKENQSEIVNGSGVDLDYFNSNTFPQNLSFLMIARFLPEKGVFEYAQACKRIKKDYPEIRCYLLGYIDSPLAGINLETVKRWESDGLDCLGKQEDIRPFMNQASVFVLPSYSEGLPRSILEAMAMRRAIITTFSAGCKETVEEERNGFLIPIKNSEALYQAMLKFIHHPSLIPSMGEESRKIAQEKFDVHKVNQHMFSIMDL